MNGKSDEKGSRFAELALELFGAKAGEEFLKNAWDEASPEVKKGLADAVVKLMTERITGGGSVTWSLDDIAKDLIRRIAEDEIAKGLPEIEGKIRERVRANLLRTWEAEADRCVTSSVMEIVTKVRAAVGARLNDMNYRRDA